MGTAAGEGAADAALDGWEVTGVRLHYFQRLHDAGALAEVPCLACGYPTLSERGGNHVCVLCHWEDDGSSRERPDRRSGANRELTLREAAANVAETGVSVSQWHSLGSPHFFAPGVRAVRADLAAAYDRLGADPADPAARADVHAGRARLMRAIVSLMR